jgi:integrase
MGRKKNAPTVTAILWSRSDKNGNKPVRIKIVVEGKPDHIALGFSVPESLWDSTNGIVRGSHANADSYNTLITEKKSACLKQITRFKMDEVLFTSKMVKEAVEGGNANSEVDMLSFIDEHLKKMKVARQWAGGTFETYNRTRNRLAQFCGAKKDEHTDEWIGGKLPIANITTRFLERFIEFLRSNMTNNSAAFMWDRLNEWLRAAHKARLIKTNPATDVEYKPEHNQRQVKEKERLSSEELATWTTLLDAIEDRRHRNTLAWFLFGCYTGLRISDWIQFDFERNVVGGRLNLKPKKTGGWIDMPLTPTIEKVMQAIQGYKRFNSETGFRKRLNALLEHIGFERHLSSHCARKTFAVTQCAEQGFTLEECAELMGITIEVCQKNYYRLSKTRLDKKIEMAWGTATKVVELARAS